MRLISDRNRACVSNSIIIGTKYLIMDTDIMISKLDSYLFWIFHGDWIQYIFLGLTAASDGQVNEYFVYRHLFSLRGFISLRALPHKWWFPALCGYVILQGWVLIRVKNREDGTRIPSLKRLFARTIWSGCQSEKILLKPEFRFYSAEW